MLNQPEAKAVDALAHAFYEIVPAQYQTHCVLTARISACVLNRLGVEATLMPCQIWLVTPTQNYIVGFVGNEQCTGKWDGHVVCRTHHFIIDAATHHFAREFSQPIARIFALPLFDLPTRVISRCDLAEGRQLWWHQPPDGVDTTVPPVPEELVEEYVSLLVRKLS